MHQERITFEERAVADDIAELQNETREPQVHPILHALEVVSRHKGLLLLGAVVGLAMGALYYVMSRPIYQSSFQVMVVKKKGDDLVGSGRYQESEDYVATHQDLIRSHVIIVRALNKPVWYKLTDATFESLRKAGMPPVVLAKLSALKNQEIKREECADVLAEVLDDKLLAEILNDPGSSTNQEVLRAEKRKQYQDLVMDRAEKRKVSELETFAHTDLSGDASDLVESIRSETTVTRNRVSGSRGNNILEVSFRGKFKAECPVFLSALVESYKEFLDDSYKSMTSDTVKLFNRARGELLKTLEDKDKAYIEFRKDPKIPLLAGRSKESADVHKIVSSPFSESKLLSACAKPRSRCRWKPCARLRLRAWTRTNFWRWSWTSTANWIRMSFAAINRSPCRTRSRLSWLKNSLY